MREHLSEYFDTEVRPTFENKDKDPWWDPVEPIIVGTSYLGLRPLTYAMGSEEVTSKILSSEGKDCQRGFLKAEFDVTDTKGEPVDEDLYADVEDKNDLLGKAYNFRMDLKEVSGLPEDLCTNPFVKYQLKYEPNVDHCTNEAQGQNTTHPLSYKKVHSIPLITDYHTEYFDKSNVAFTIFAYPYYKGSQ